MQYDDVLEYVAQQNRPRFRRIERFMGVFSCLMQWFIAFVVYGAVWSDPNCSTQMRETATNWIVFPSTAFGPLSLALWWSLDYFRDEDSE